MTGGLGEVLSSEFSGKGGGVDGCTDTGCSDGEDGAGEPPPPKPGYGKEGTRIWGREAGIEAGSGAWDGDTGGGVLESGDGGVGYSH